MPSILSVRFDDEILALIDAAAARKGQKRSIWARETLVAAATDSSVQPHPKRALKLQGPTRGQPAGSGCIHPPTARKKTPFVELCELCGVKVRDL